MLMIQSTLAGIVGGEKGFAFGWVEITMYPMEHNTECMTEF